MLKYIERLYGDEKEYTTRKEADDAFKTEVVVSGLVVQKDVKVVVD